ncbi:MAG: hypothetical protein AB7N65_08555 [Vicinamibacterales bacterium]
MEWQTVVAGLVLGVAFGALTAVGAFLAALLLGVMYHATGFQGRRPVRLAKFLAFLIFGVLFIGLGTIFAPLALGMFAAWGIGNDPTTPARLDAVFYVGYFGAIAFYAIFGVGSLLRHRDVPETGPDIDGRGG